MRLGTSSLVLACFCLPGSNSHRHPYVPPVGGILQNSLDSCTNVIDRNSLEQCEPYYRKHSIESCPDVTNINYHSPSASMASSKLHKMSWGFLKMFGKTEVNPQMMEKYLSKSTDDPQDLAWLFSSGDSAAIMEIMKYNIMALFSLALAILALIACLVYICPGLCCRCCREYCGCCCTQCCSCGKNSGCCGACGCCTCCSCCCIAEVHDEIHDDNILQEITEEVAEAVAQQRAPPPSALHWIGPSVVAALGVLFISISVAWTTFLKNDFYALECCADGTMYQLAYGSFQTNSLTGTSRFGGVTDMEDFLSEMKSELIYANSVFQGWNVNIPKLLSGYVTDAYAPVNWTSYNLNERLYSQWMAYDGTFPEVGLGHVLIANEVLFEGSDALMNVSTSYKSYLDVFSNPTVTDQFSLTPDQISQITSSISGATDAIQNIIDSINFNDLYSTISDVYSSIEDVEDAVYTGDAEHYIYITFIVLIVVASLSFLFIPCGLLAYYCHWKNQRLLSANPKAKTGAGCLGCSACCLSSCGVIYLLVSFLGIVFSVMPGDVCSFADQSLFTEGRYTDYPIIAETFNNTNVTSHCLMYGSDGNILAAFNVEESLDELINSANQFETQINQLTSSSIFPDEIRPQLVVDIPTEVSSFIANEKEYYPSVISSLRNVDISTLMTSYDVLFTGLSDSSLDIKDGSRTAAVMSEMYSTPVFDHAAWPSFNDFPWRDSKTPPKQIKPFSSATSGLQDIIREVSECSVNASSVYVGPSDTAPSESALVINSEQVYFISPSAFNSEASVTTMSFSTLPMNPNLIGLFSCMDRAPIKSRVKFIAGVYQGVLKSLAKTNLVPVSANHAKDDFHFDVCAMGLACPPFVYSTTASDSSRSNYSAKSYDDFANGLRDSLDKSVKWTDPDSVGNVLISGVAGANILTRARTTLENFNNIYNCREMFQVPLTTYDQICKALLGDIATVTFMCWLQGVLLLMCGIWIFVWFFREKSKKDKLEDEEEKMKSRMTELDSTLDPTTSLIFV